MNSLLVWLTGFYCLGIILASLKLINFWLAILVGIFIYFVVSKLQTKSFIFLSAVLFLTVLLGFFNLKNAYRLPKNHINNFVIYKDNQLYSLNGYVDSQPELKNNSLSFIFRLQSAQADKLRFKSCGKVLVKINFNQALSYGTNLTLIGKLSRPYGYNRASYSYKEYLKRLDIYLVMSIKDVRQVIIQPGFGGSKLIAGSFWLRSKMEEAIYRALPELPASLLAAMVLGQKRNVPWLINDLMIKSGTVHILVVSGFNVSIVAFIINLLFKILRIPRKQRLILAIICLLIYCAVTGASNPVVRATVMGVVFLSAYFFKRDFDIYNSLALSALFILIIAPRQFFDIGFQLSFISVWAIIYLYPKLKAFFHLEDYKNKIWKFIGEGFLVSLSAWLGTLWIIAFNFRIIAPITIIANILIVPLATVITLSGFTLVVFGLIHPYLASLFSAPVALFINLLLSINTAIIKLPFAYIRY
ncbi:MAG: ComEC/Rec2 family competence protein [Candidatus Omnitrophota bacterium]